MAYEITTRDVGFHANLNISNIEEFITAWQEDRGEAIRAVADRIDNTSLLRGDVWQVGFMGALNDQYIQQNGQDISPRGYNDPHSTISTFDAMQSSLFRRAQNAIITGSDEELYESLATLSALQLLVTDEAYSGRGYQAELAARFDSDQAGRLQQVLQSYADNPYRAHIPASHSGDHDSVIQNPDVNFQIGYDSEWNMFGNRTEHGFELQDAEGNALSGVAQNSALEQIVQDAHQIEDTMYPVFLTRIQNVDGRSFDEVTTDDLESVEEAMNLPRVVPENPSPQQVVDALAMRAYVRALQDLENVDERDLTRYQIGLEPFIERADQILENAGVQPRPEPAPADILPEAAPADEPAAVAENGDINVEINIETGDITIIIAPTFNITDITVENLGPVINNAIIAHCQGDDGELDQDRLNSLLNQHNEVDGATINIIQNFVDGDTTVDVDVNNIDIDLNQLVIQQITVIQGDVNIEAETDADAPAAETEEAPEVVEEAAPAAEPAAPAREPQHWFYRGNRSEGIAELQRALGVDPAYRGRLSENWHTYDDGEIGSRTEGVILDYARTHDIDPRTMSLEDFTNHVRDNLTADATLAAEIEAAEPVVETIVEAAERAAAEAAVEAAAEEAAAEATHVAAETAILTDSNRVLHHEVIARAEALWEAATTDGSLAADAMLTTMDLGLFDGATPMLIREINGEIVVTQIHEGNADTLPETYQLSAALQADLLDERRSGRDHVEDNGVRVEVDPVTGGLNYDTLTITASHDNDFTSTFVRHANGGGTVYETDELADALDRYDGRANERGQYGEDLDNLEEALRDGEIEGLTVTFMDSGLVTIEGTTAEADAEGISIQIPQELYDRIMERANSDHAPAAQVGPAATNSIAPPTTS